MNIVQLIEKIQVLPKEKQAEVFDFVDYLATRFARPIATDPVEWTDKDFSRLSMAQAMRGMEQEPDIYSQHSSRDTRLLTSGQN